MASVLGFIFGPYIGALSAFLGAFVTWVLPPSSMSPGGAPFLLSPPLNALAVGFIFYKRWKWSFALFAVLIAVFVFLPPSQPIGDFWYISVAVLWDKIIALVLIIPAVVLAARSSSPKWLATIFFMISFVGNQVDNMWGSDVFSIPAVYSGIYQMPVDAVRLAFVVSPFVYPIIRITQAFIAMLIAIPLITVLKNSKWIMREDTIFDKSGTS